MAHDGIKQSGASIGLVLVLATGAAWAQVGPPPNQPQNPPPNQQGPNQQGLNQRGPGGRGPALGGPGVRGPGQPAPNRPGLNQQPPNAMNGTWWRTPQADVVGVNPDQRKKLDDLFQQHRLRRVDLEAAQQKAQLTLEPLWQADAPDEGKILSQIDRVTQAQAELRKDEARYQLGMRQILTPDQWRRLQEVGRTGPGGPPQVPNGPQQRLQGQPQPPNR